MFFNYISTAIIPPFFQPETCNLQISASHSFNDAKYVHPPRPSWQPEKSLIFRRGGTDGAPNPDLSGFLPRSPFRRQNYCFFLTYASPAAIYLLSVFIRLYVPW